ncbi:MAG: hypothetical protein QM759_12880 [Terricaulis sp.]
MGGWRDTDGRTASERKQQRRAADRVAFINTARQRPFSLLKGLLGFVLILTLCIGVLLFMH